MKTKKRTLVHRQRRDVGMMLLVFVIEWSMTIRLVDLPFARGRTLTFWSIPTQVMPLTMVTTVLLYGMTGLGLKLSIITYDS